MNCRRCGSERIIKNGHHLGRRRFKRQGCGFLVRSTGCEGETAADEVPCAHPSCDRAFPRGLSHRSSKSRRRPCWTGCVHLAARHTKSRRPRGKSLSSLTRWGASRRQKNKLWVWKAYCRTTGQLVDWECGRRDAATLSKLLKRLERLNVKVYFADQWEAYAELIPPEKLIQTKAGTHGVEWNDFRQRHGLGRFRRKTCIVSRSLERVGLSISLFARFRVNGTPHMITSFFS
jgi:insertion element IS1 protein InsB